MRRQGVIAAVLAVCAAVLLSAPARADQYDYISQLDNMGVSYGSILDMIDIGKAVCHELRYGVTPPVVLGELGTAGFAPAESAIVLLAAVDHMCWDVKPAVVAWARATSSTSLA